MTIVVLVLSTILILLGIQEYKRALEAKPLEAYVVAIQSEPGFVRLDEVEDMFIEAIVAVEDRRFWTRGSVLDFRSIGRAVYVNVTNLSFVEGASTIPQQVAKNMYFDESVSIVRKIAEYFVAKHIDALYSREEILELYINKIYYGADAYGISEASAVYFETTPDLLSDGQAVLLAGLVQSPSLLNPFINYDLAKERQRLVLNRLIDVGALTPEEADEIYQMEVFQNEEAFN